MQIAMKAVGGGLMALVALYLAKMIFGVLGTMFLFLVAVFFKILLVVLIVWLVRKLLRSFKDKPAFND